MLTSESFERGLVAASVIAANLRHAYQMWKLFPALKICKVISSDFQENYDTRRVTDGFENVFVKLAYGSISHLVVHDVIANTTTVMPFRSLGKLKDATGRRMRENMLHEWRDENNVSYNVTLEQAESFIEHSWLRQPDGTRTPKSQAF